MNPITMRAAYLPLFLAAVSSGSAPAGEADPAAPLRTALERHPAGGALGRVDAGPRLAAATASGLEAEFSVEEDEAGGGILLRGSIRNPGPAAVPSAALAADWTFDLGGPGAGRYRPLEHRSDVWYGSTYWTGPDWTRVGRDWQHSGEVTASVRRFTAPRDGRVTVTGRAAKAHVDAKTDGVRLAIRHAGREVWSAEIDGGDATGVEARAVLDVQKGDAIRFVVSKRGLIICDTTRWDPSVAYDDGETFVASRSFSTVRGEGGWSAEMEVDPRSVAGLPEVRWLERGLALREEVLRDGSPVVLDDRCALPIAALSAGGGDGGLVLIPAGAAAWGMRIALDGAGRLLLDLSGAAPSGALLAPGEKIAFPPLAFLPFRGPWMGGLAAAARLASEGRSPAGDALRAAVPALRELAGTEEIDLWALVQSEWRREDRIDETPGSYSAAAARHAGKALALLEDLREGGPSSFLAEEAARLVALFADASRPAADLAEARALWNAVRLTKRRISLANPLLGAPILFAKRVPTSYSHLVMQYYGWRARPGGGLFALERPGRSLACRPIDGGRLAGGSVLEPRLSFDGRRIVFSFVRTIPGEVDPLRLANDEDRGFYHIFSIDVDGRGLRQLSAGPWDDLMPDWLPDGGIVFSSTRRRGYARCFGAQFSPRWHVYTLHRMDADGGNLRALSFHDTNEWFPTAAADGSILYSRWDYIDRDAVTHQNLWTTRPDGTSPAALWGNATPSPHCAFQARTVPGSRKIVFTASAHHSVTAGSIVLLDPAVARDGHGGLVRLTPEVPFPEAEGVDIREYYESPWPLSERHFLVAYSPRPLIWEPGANEAAALGIYLLDAFGNREVLYRDPVIGSTSPCPLEPRPAPPVVTSDLPADEPETGEMVLTDVYRGLGPAVPRGTIRELRIVQIFPKATPVGNSPPIGLAGEENGRAILGTVPVEADGSARFLVPARRPLLFQALDAEGLARQTMRTVTYVQPGEKVSCAGCHEDRMAAPPALASPLLALGRPPSAIDPGELGGRPFSFAETVQPMLDRLCVSCHGGGKTEGKIDLTAVPRDGFTRSYWALCGDRKFDGGGTNPRNAAEALVPRFGMRNAVAVTPPGGMYGAAGSRLLKILREGHAGTVLEPADLRRLAAWIDLNAIFYGVNSPAEQSRQIRGERVGMPELQ